MIEYYSQIISNSFSNGVIKYHDRTGDLLKFTIITQASGA